MIHPGCVAPWNGACIFENQLCEAACKLVVLYENLQHFSNGVDELYVFQKLEALLNGCFVTELSESESSSFSGGIGYGSGVGSQVTTFC